MEAHGLSDRCQWESTDCRRQTKTRPMRTAMITLLGFIALAFGAGTAQAADVGLSISVGQPGFYGRINIGGYPPPALVYGQPILAEPDDGYPGHPIYLRVPPRWARHWRRHCAEFRACHRPVYFVREGWYNNVYMPQYRRGHDRGWTGGHGDDGYWRHGDHGFRGGHGDDGHWRHGYLGGERGDNNRDH